jgi:hypothetical protein
VSTLTPANQFSFYSSYRLGGSLSGLTLGGGARWQDKTSGDISTPAGGTVTPTVKGYWIVDAMARYEFSKQLSASLSVKNCWTSATTPSSTGTTPTHGGSAQREREHDLQVLSLGTGRPAHGAGRLLHRGVTLLGFRLSYGKRGPAPAPPRDSYPGHHPDPPMSMILGFRLSYMLRPASPRVVRGIFMTRAAASYPGCWPPSWAAICWPAPWPYSWRRSFRAACRGGAGGHAVEFALHVLAVIWAFSPVSPGRVWLGLLLPAVVLAAPRPGWLEELEHGRAKNAGAGQGGFRQAQAWLHTWCGLWFSWLLFAVFLTGTLAVFEEPISTG